MEPSTKSPAMEAALTRIFGQDRRQSIKNEVCMCCGQPFDGFRDELSRKEASISGLCQSCQDKTF